MRKINGAQKSTRFIFFATALAFCFSFALMALPSFSAENGWLLYSTSGAGNFEIEMIHLDGSGRQNLTNTPQQEPEADWSPNGKQIVFSRQPAFGDCRRDIFLLDIETNSVKQITNHPACDSTPKWSPNGKTIAFVSDREGGRDIYLMNPDGSNIRKLTDGREVNFYLNWSPSGNQLVFTSTSAVLEQIYIIKVDGTGEKRLSPRDTKDCCPVFSPDGEQITFGRSLPDRSDFKLYVMDVDGKDQRPFLEDFGGKEFIDSGILWLPDARILFSGAFPSFPLADRTSGVFAVEGENAEPVLLIEWENFPMHIASWFDPAFSVQPNGKLLTTWGQTKSNKSEVQ